jgi:hypothetical protein
MNHKMGRNIEHTDNLSVARKEICSFFVVDSTPNSISDPKTSVKCVRLPFEFLANLSVVTVVAYRPDV